MRRLTGAYAALHVILSSCARSPSPGASPATASASGGGPVVSEMQLASSAFEPVQPELFSAPGAQPNAWADYDNDGDLDLFVGFRGGRNRLYRNDGGRFVDVAAAVGLADTMETRAASWGDFDADGHIDLYVGFTPAAQVPNRLYRNEGNGRRFTDVAQSIGLAVRGTTRQPSWIDYDNDGDLDLFVAFRDLPNALFRNDRGRYTDVARDIGLDDRRKTVGVVWYDMDQDGDLDVFVANQEGDANGFFRNDGARFIDIAGELGVSQAGRPADHGGVGPSVADFDNDGDFDLFVANYGPDVLYRNDGGRLTNIAKAAGVGEDYHSTSAAWADLDNDGRLDLYVVSYLANERNARDHLFLNQGGERFVDVISDVIMRNDASHGIAWADFDADGDLDLALANNHAQGTHYLFRNLLAAERARRSLQVTVRDEQGRHTRAGSEVRVYRAGTRELLGTRLVDTGGGYDSQGVTPVHFGLPTTDRVDVEVTSLGRSGRRITSARRVDPRSLGRKPLEIRVGSDQ